LKTSGVGVITAARITITRIAYREFFKRKLGEVSEAVYRQDSDALVAHSRFPEQKFGRSNLTLPSG